MKEKGAIYWFLTLLFLGTIPALADSSVDWPTLGFTQVVTNTFNHPTAITHAGDGSGRLFVVEQPGNIRIIQNSNVLVQPFLDITNRVIINAEQGLLGLAFPPGFATNNHFYVCYTRKPDGWIVVSRFQVSTNSNVADTNSEQVIMLISKSFVNHNGGQIAFGPDGYLYIGVGDGGSEGDPQLNGQKTNTLLGKLLRIDVESGASPYAIPSSNPFVGNTNYFPEIWAVGLRNPWRFSFDRLTGDLYLSDVGQNRFEEINFQAAGSAGGENYGWRIMEGSTNYNVPPGFTNFSQLTLPVASYDHLGLPTDLSGSVTGGYVYRGPGGSRMDGVYFYGDFMAGWIWGLKQVGTNWQTAVLATAINPPAFVRISTFGEDEQGRLYLGDYYAGKISQIGDSHQVWTPKFAVPSGIINSNTVSLTSLTTNAVIHYTTNGIDPTESNLIVPPGGIIDVASGVTYKAKAFRPGLTPSGVASAVYSFRVGTPIFTPPAGPITSNSSLTITCVTPGATIYYTTNNTTPTTSSLIYSSPLTINAGAIVRAIALANGFPNSLAAFANYTAAQVATPVFTPATGPITNGTSISIFCTTPGAVIYYTLDGSNPSTSSPVYSTPLTINGFTTVKAFAVASGYVNSAIKGVLYPLVQTVTPVFSPSSGPITNGTSISISCATPASVIYYTLDGTAPTTNSPAYSGPLAINGGTTLKALAATDGYVNSTIRSVFYSLVQTATPVSSPASGPITNGTSISISCATPGAVIYYTLDGTPPTTSSTIYSGPLTVNGGTTVNAFAVASGHLDSAPKSVFFALVQTAAPVFSPSSGSISNGTSLSISCATPGAVIFYTVDGSAPTINSPVYTGPVTINGGTTVSAFAVTSEHLDSAVQSTLYPLVQTATPIFSQPAGAVQYGTTISISCATPGATIYYTLNGTTPTTNSLVYTSPLTVSDPVIITAFAVASEHIDSVVEGALYTIIKAATPVLSPSQGPLTNGAWITATCSTPNAVIYYSMNGFDPDTNSKVYSGPLLFNSPMTLKAFAYAPGCDPSDIRSIYYAMSDFENTVVTTLAGSPTAGFSNAPGTLAKFSSPSGLCIDQAGNLYVADTGNHVIRKISTSGQVTTFAGTGVAGSQDGSALNAQFFSPMGVCIDQIGNLYVSDGCNIVRRIDTNGIVTTFPNPVNSGCTIGQIEVDPAGNLYVGSWATVRKVSPSGTVVKLAGSGLNGADGWGANVGVGIDTLNNIYAATLYQVWKIAPNGTAQLFAGGPSPYFTQRGYSDGPGSLSLFEVPQEAAADSANNIYISDGTRVRKIRTNGWVSTLSGTGVPGYVNGLASKAQFQNASGLCADGQGNIYVADAGNNCIRKISTVPVGSPPLQISLTINKAILSWPLWAGDFSLETSSSLSSNAAWTPLINGVTTSVNNFVLTNNFGTSASFYRLHKQ
jgi:streptogramin lyase